VRFAGRVNVGTNHLTTGINPESLRLRRSGKIDGGKLSIPGSQEAMNL